MIKNRKFLGVELCWRWMVCVPAALFLALGEMPEAQAIEIATLYTAEIPLDPDADDPRNDAYAAALVEVLLRVSGPELVNNPEVIEELFPNPAAYVTQYRPGSDASLWVSFDGQAIEAKLRNAGQTIWGSDRPLTIVWLAVDWGRGEREIIAAGDPNHTQQQARSIDRNRMLRERVLEIAAQRGLPLAFPLLDTTDLQKVTFSDIWGGFDDRVLDASQRYEANSVLIGRLRPSSSQRNRWSYYFHTDRRSWNGQAEAIINQVADLLAAEFAVGGNAPIELLVLSVAGIESIDAYGAVQQLLSGVSLIESYMIAEVSGDTVSYWVEVRGGAERLRRALRFNGLIEQESMDEYADPQAVSALEFFYSP
ncbi:MAG: DUF2066 domain-containing protein [Proteobacteria bacterium]|nr:DUF2066 domain-containing protein [Pseudomonadota bacterium]